MAIMAWGKPWLRRSIRFWSLDATPFSPNNVANSISGKACSRTKAGSHRMSAIHNTFSEERTHRITPLCLVTSNELSKMLHTNYTTVNYNLVISQSCMARSIASVQVRMASQVLLTTPRMTNYCSGCYLSYTCPLQSTTTTGMAISLADDDNDDDDDGIYYNLLIPFELQFCVGRHGVDYVPMNDTQVCITWQHIWRNVFDY